MAAILMQSTTAVVPAASDLVDEPGSCDLQCSLLMVQIDVSSEDADV